MGWLVGLPLGLFRLLGGILMVGLRFVIPILILVAIILLVRKLRKASARYQEEKGEPEFDGPVYTVDYQEVDDDDSRKEP